MDFSKREKLGKSGKKLGGKFFKKRGNLGKISKKNFFVGGKSVRKGGNSPKRGRSGIPAVGQNLSEF